MPSSSEQPSSWAPWRSSRRWHSTSGWPTPTVSSGPRGRGCRCWWGARSSPTCCRGRCGSPGCGSPRCRRSSAPGSGTHWTRERITLVVMGVVCFYITYVSYRNLKSFLPFVLGDQMYDRELHLLDRLLLFGHDPGVLMHDAARHRVHRVGAVLRLPVVPAAGAAGADGVAGLVAQPDLRLLVRDLAVHRLGARDAVLLRAADARARASSTPLPTSASPTPPPRR